MTPDINATATSIGILAILFMVAGLSFLGHVALNYRSGVARRIDELLQGQSGGVLESTDDADRQARRPLVSVTALPVREQTELERRFVRRGMSPRSAALIFFALRIVSSIVLAGVLVLVGARFGTVLPSAIRVVGFALLGALLGAYLPFLGLRFLAARRVAAIEHDLPDAIELLVVSIEAGLSLEAGIERIAVEMQRSQPELAEELAVISADLKLLPEQRDALLKFADRMDRPGIRAVMTTLAQTMRYGTPLAQALRVTAGEMRNEAILKLEEHANRMPVLLTIPMIVFLMPAIFLVIGGPAILRLVDVLFR